MKLSSLFTPGSYSTWRHPQSAGVAHVQKEGLRAAVRASHSRVQGSYQHRDKYFRTVSDPSHYFGLLYLGAEPWSNWLYITVFTVPGAVLFWGRCRLELLVLQSLPPNFHSNYRGRDELELNSPTLGWEAAALIMLILRGREETSQPASQWTQRQF